MKVYLDKNEYTYRVEKAILFLVVNYECNKKLTSETCSV